MQTDDDVYAVDNHWLGPPGRTFAWRARYSAYGVFGGAVLGVLALERRAGIGFGLWSFIYGVLIAVVITRALMSLVNYERPVRTLFTVFAHEISAPRRRSQSQSSVLSPRRVPVRRRNPGLELLADVRQDAIRARREARGAAGYLG
ncbi:MAG TPA: hypothetical protein VLJ59_15830 [Mycobacteriales bacterium]|nr:hypothetical protein [Mycobacteriales bacterium]